VSAWPHDDTTSLIGFYGDPRRAGFTRNLVLVVPPWQMTYDGRPIRGVQIHRKCAESLKAVFDDIAQQIGHDWSRLPAGAVRFSGSYNFRPIRGSSRMSCHAFGAAIDLDAPENGMNTRGDKGTMSPIVIAAFKRQGWYWGGDFRGRQDPMHFQAANEASRVAELAADLNPVSSAQAAEMPPVVDGHSEAEEAELPQSGIEELPEHDAPIGVFRSPIAWLTGGLGTTSAASAVSTDPALGPLLERIAGQPAFWIALAAILAAGAVAYLHWRNSSKARSW